MTRQNKDSKMDEIKIAEFGNWILTHDPNTETYAIRQKRPVYRRYGDGNSVQFDGYRTSATAVRITANAAVVDRVGQTITLREMLEQEGADTLESIVNGGVKFTGL